MKHFNRVLLAVVATAAALALGTSAAVAVEGGTTGGSTAQQNSIEWP
ncbi:hypothetical protein [Streptomyces sp. NPDC088752]